MPPDDTDTVLCSFCFGTLSVPESSAPDDACFRFLAVVEEVLDAELLAVLKRASSVPGSILTVGTF